MTKPDEENSRTNTESVPQASASSRETSPLAIQIFFGTFVVLFAALLVDQSGWGLLLRLVFFVAIAAGLAFWVSGVVARSVIEPLTELLEAEARRTPSPGLGIADAVGSLIRRLKTDASLKQVTAQIEVSKLRQVLDGMDEAVFVTDAEGKINLFNQALTTLVLRPPLGLTTLEAIRSTELHSAVEHALRQGGAHRLVFELPHADGTRNLSAYVGALPTSPLSSTRTTSEGGVVVVLQDVTELRRAESVRRDFVANASHELRTPLTAIRGFAETLRDGALSDPAIATRFVTAIAENGKRLQRLVDDLLELSRSESPDVQFDMTDVELNAAILDVIRALEGRALEHNVTVQYQPRSEIYVRANPRALDQIVMNLLDNAIKYTPRQGAVEISVKATPDWVEVRLMDNGPGIPAKDVDRIFERFYRVDAGRARDQGGTGLGLAIVKHLTQRLSGEVFAESDYGQGTTFVLRLRPSSV